MQDKFWDMFPREPKKGLNDTEKMQKLFSEEEFIILW
jgi:hypothetical protein